MATPAKRSGRNNLGQVYTMKAKDVLKVERKTLPFTGEWKFFFGEPEPNFFMLLSGQPGDGKSSLSLKFGNYLARNFGNVAYLTNEENDARIKLKLETLKEELEDNYDIVFNVNSYEAARKEFARGIYKFIFIDSAQGGEMDHEELWNLHCDFPDIAIIAICRETKDGKARGSQHKEYDGDITVKFKYPGTATTVKNRFGEAGRNLIIFIDSRSEPFEDRKDAANSVMLS